MALFPNWSGSASPSSYRCSPTCGRTWCSATIGRTFPAPTMTWSAAFAGSRPSTAASVVARIGTPICYATGARSPTPPGGSKMRPIESRWNSAPPSWTVPAGANCDGRPPSLRASNSRAFVFVTSASPCSFPSKSAGPLLLSRHLCPDGFFQPDHLRTQLANLGVQLGELLLMDFSQFCCAVLFLKEPWQPFQGNGSPMLQLGRMDFILAGNLSQRLLFFQEFLNDSRFERGCILLSHHA